jgi:DNA-binding response OmpR family regulator
MRMPARVLVVDDDPAILEGLQALLSAEGYVVVTAANGRAAVGAYRECSPDLILLDVLMPEMSGLEVCQRIRQENLAVPIIMLTARTEESDRVLGLELGADDYVVKPFGTDELLARVHAALRRSSVVPPGLGTFECDELRVDFDRHQVQLRGAVVPLTTREFELLAHLVQRRGSLISRGELLRQVWGYQHEDLITTRTVDNHILRLRKKLERDPSHPRHIMTVRRAGYLFEAE